MITEKRRSNDFLIPIFILCFLFLSGCHRHPTGGYIEKQIDKDVGRQTGSNQIP